MTGRRKTALAGIERIIKRTKAKQTITAQGPPDSIRRASTNGYATDDRIVRPGHGVSHDADPADAAERCGIG